MATNYIVVCDKIAGTGYRLDYFPRGFHYKKDANSLVAEVKDRGGKAHVVPKSQFTPELLYAPRSRNEPTTNLLDNAEIMVDALNFAIEDIKELSEKVRQGDTGDSFSDLQTAIDAMNMEGCRLHILKPTE